MSPPNLIILIIDTLRADAPLSDAPDGPMPRLGALANRSVCFTQASAASTWTVPSVTSLLTGLLPTEHGCVENSSSPRLPESITTYAEVLQRAHHYETAAFTDAPWFRGRSASILQGFGSGSEGGGARLALRRPAASGFWLQGASTVLRPWNELRDHSRPFFLLLHSFDAHDPYGATNHPNRGPLREGEEPPAPLPPLDLSSIRTPEDYLRVFLTDRVGRDALMQSQPASFYANVTQSMWSGFRNGANADLCEMLRGSYLEGLRWVDDGIDRTVALLGEIGLLENTLLVVAGDHGEAFAEHGTVGHGHHLYDELLRVPLVFVGPGPFSQHRFVEVSVGLVDVLPTFLDWAGLPDIQERHGRSLLPLLASQRPTGHPVRAEMLLSSKMCIPGVERLYESVRSEHWKYIGTLDPNLGTISEELYDLRADPEELNDLLRNQDLEAMPLGLEFCREMEKARGALAEQHSRLRQRRTLGLGVDSRSVARWQPSRSPCTDDTEGSE